MTLRSWMSKIFGSRPRTIVSSRSARRRPRLGLCLETLEDRLTPSVITNLDDHGPGSLRAAVEALDATITFDQSLSGTIVLTNGELLIERLGSTTITGTTGTDGANKIAISGNFVSRVFNIDSGAVATISNLTIEYGFARNANGGAIFNNGSLTLIKSTVSGSIASGNDGFRPNSWNNQGAGGGIYNALAADLNVVQSTISGNTSQGGRGGYSSGGGGGGGGAGMGGGIFSGGFLTMVNSTVSGNAALGGTGGNGSNFPTFGSLADGGNGGGYGGPGRSNSAGWDPQSQGNGGFGGGGGGGSGSGAVGQNYPGDQGFFGGGGGGGGAYTGTGLLGSSIESGGSGGRYGGNGGPGGNTGSPGDAGHGYSGGGGGGTGIGGGIFSKGRLTITASTIANNSAQGGPRGSAGGSAGMGVAGGVFIYSVGATLDSTIIAGNSVDGPGEGLSADARVSHLTPVVHRAGLLTTITYNPDCVFSGNYNLIGDKTGVYFVDASHDNILGVNDSASLLLPLAENGGPTQTMALRTSGLSGPNPALGAGNPNITSPISHSHLFLDQRGVPRESPPDIGAYETALAPTLTVSPSAASLTLGASPVTLKATATLDSQVGFSGGTITFTLYFGNTVLDTETVPLANSRTYSTPTGYTLPSTGAALGVYRWNVTYSGDKLHAPVSENTQVTISKSNPALTLSAIPSSIPFGLVTSLKATANISGYNPTGTLIFTLYRTGINTPVDTETVTVNGNGSYTTQTGFGSYDSQSAASYQWNVSYNGDANNNGVSDNNDSKAVVTIGAFPTLTSFVPSGFNVYLGISSPTLTVGAGLFACKNPTGFIAFNLYRMDNVATLVFSEAVDVNGNGGYMPTTGYTLPTTGEVAGEYQWNIIYSGDQNNDLLQNFGPSGQVHVFTAHPQLTAAPTPTLALVGGPPLKDTVTLTGGYYAHGKISFDLSINGINVHQEEVNVDGDGTYTTPAGFTVPTQPLPEIPSWTGTYQWDVIYNGDPNNFVVKDLGDPVQQVVVTNPTAFISTSQTSLNLAASTYGTPGTATTFTVSATGCTQNVNISAPAGVEISTNGVTWSNSLSLPRFLNQLLPTVINVRASALDNAGTLSGNIAITTAGAIEKDVSISVTINAKPLTVSIIGDPTKTYDGNTAATLESSNFMISGLVTGNNFTVTKTSGSFNDKNVSNAAFVAASLSAGDFTAATGTLASNYSFPVSATGAGHITPRSLTVSATGINRTYDGTTDATVTLSDNRITGDQISEAYNAATFADKNAGTGKQVIMSGISISGADAGNYNLVSTTATTTAKILRRTLTVSATVQDKVYDGTANGTATLSDDRLAGDQFTDAYVAVFFVVNNRPTKNVGTNLTVGAGGISISGPDAQNYALAKTFALTTASITKADATINVTPYSVTYDGQAHTATASIHGVQLGTDANGNPVYEALSGLDLSGTTHTNAGSYTDTWTFMNVTGNYKNASGSVADNIASPDVTITALDSVTLTAAADGTPVSAVQWYVNSGNGFTAIDGATNATLTLNNVRVSQNGYQYEAIFTNSAGSVMTRVVTLIVNAVTPTVTVTDEGGVYKGTAYEAAATVNGGQSLENVSPSLTYYVGSDTSGTPLTGAPSNVGAYTVVAFFAGSDDYTSASAQTTFTIGKADAVFDVTSYDVDYDGKAHTATGTAKGVNGETLVGLDLSGTTHTNAGSYTDGWTFTDVTGNYKNASGSVDDRIAQRSITVTASPTSKKYGAADPALTYQVTAGSLASGDAFSGSLLRKPGEGVGSYPILQNTLTAGGNYALSYVGANLTISQAASAVVLASTTAVSVPGQPVTFTATIVADGALSGSVTFKDGSSVLGTVAVVGGKASIVSDGLTLGDHTIAATYSGDSNRSASGPVAIVQQVQQAALERDPLNPDGMALFVGGTSGDDEIHIERVEKDCYKVEVHTKHSRGDDAVWHGTFTGPISRIVVYGGAGNDKIYLADDITVQAWLYGGAGDDAIHGASGDDTIIDLIGNNDIHAGKGDNVILVGDGNNKIWTVGGIDSITAGNGNNEIHAGGNSDTIVVGNGNNMIRLSGGADVLTAGDGSNTILGGSGNDRITVGNGDNTIGGGAGNDVIVTGNGNNSIDGGAGNDTIVTGSGHDTIDAGAGDDLVRAGAGNDDVRGGAGDDILVGGDGDDVLVGGEGRDLIIGGFGADRLIGNAGEDLLIAGYTSYDANDLALSSIMAEWTSGNSYATRIANLKTGGGLSAGNRLNGDDGALQTVFNDNSVDTLTGNQGQDCFLANQVADNGGAVDVVSDQASNEICSDTDF